MGTAIAASVALAGAAVVFTIADDETAETVSNLGILTAAVVASLACFEAARECAGAERRTWHFLGAATASWGAGQTIWTYYETLLHQEVPFPSLADLGYLGAVPLGVAALLALLAVEHSAAGRARAVLDGLIVGASLLVVSWELILERLVESDSGALLSKVIGLAYPVGDIVLITLALFLIARHPGRRLPAPLLLIAMGWLAVSFADSGFAYLALTDSYASGSLIDLGWMTGFVLIVLAALHPSAPTLGNRREAGDDVRRSVGLFLPYLAVVVTSFFAVAQQVDDGRLDSFLVWNLVSIILLVIARQVLTLRENLSLTRHLEARVVERTKALHASEQRFKSLVQNSSEVVTVVDALGTVTYQSESIATVFGHDARDVIGSSFARVISEDDGRSFVEALTNVASATGKILNLEVTIRHSDGRLCRGAITLNNLLEDPNVRGIVLNTRDISEQKALEEQLAHQAFHDSLTALANRALFKDRVEQALRRRIDRGSRVAVLFLDLDGFKQVNDSLGHVTGDLLLVQVGQRLRKCVRPADTVARLGGDEFAVLIDNARARADVRVAQTIIRQLKHPFDVGGREIFVRASVGIATSDGDVTSADQLLRNADLAMYRAKAAREGGYERYEPGMHTQVVRRMELEADLRRAVAGSELFLAYQPTLALASGEVVGVEALVRWNHAVHGMVPPVRFVDLAEETGIIHDLGRFVLREACLTVARWNVKSPARRLSVGVNVSASQIRRRDIVGDVEEALEVSALAPELLTLEMTESVLLGDESDTIPTLERLKELGILLAIDDFGTGYSSLSYLLRLPVDVLKIDRSFVEQLRGAWEQDQLVRTIVRLGHGLGLRTIAEGIENQVQHLALARMGCQFGQGYYFWPPLNPADIEELLDTETAPASG